MARNWEMDRGEYMKLFFDTEFTGLHKNTTLISLGIIDENGDTFYAEFNDYDKTQVNDWIKDNVISNLQFIPNYQWEATDRNMVVVGSSQQIRQFLLKWLSKYDTMEFWSDCLAFDWVLLNELIANYSDGYPKLPSNVYYIPFDICTVFKLKGIDPDISRKEYSGIGGAQHNALVDAEMIKKCYEKLMEEK